MNRARFEHILRGISFEIDVASLCLDVGASKLRRWAPESAIQININAHELLGMERSIVADASAMPFPAETFDRVYSSFLFCSTGNQTEIAQEIHRVLKPGGEVVSIEHEASRYKSLRRTQGALDVLRRISGRCRLAGDAEPHFVQAGLVVTEVHVWDDWIQPIVFRRLCKPCET